MSAAEFRTDASEPDTSRVVLILSADAIAAALIAAMVETLGYTVHFAPARAYADDAMRRARPKICLVNWEDPEMRSDEILGRATMRKIPIIIFGSAAAIEHVRELVTRHHLQSLLMPTTIADLEAVLERALTS